MVCRSEERRDEGTISQVMGVKELGKNHYVFGGSQVVSRLSLP